MSTIILPLLFCLSIISNLATSSPVASTVACHDTPYPSYCNSILPRDTSQNLSTFSLVSLSKSLNTASFHVSTIFSYLKQKRSSLSSTAVIALQDCTQLASLTIDSLSSTNATLSTAAATTTLSEDKISYVHTLLSATLTNLETCLDGIYILNQTELTTNVYNQLSNGTMLYSVALSLFKQAWVDKGQVNPQFDGKNLGRRLLQVVGSGVVVSAEVVVSQDGSGNFTTITDAVNSAPNNSNGSSYYLIYVKAGVYQEYVSIPSKKKYIMMVGDGINQTVVTGNNSVGGGSTTFNSATFAVVATGFVGINMTFQNTAGPSNHQAVALRSGADLSTFYLCSFDAYQDTLYTHSMRQFYRECDIYGTVDFIFGNAAVVLQNCNIYPRLPLPGQSDPMTAQGRTDINQNTGTSIINCNITPTPDLVNTTVKVYLGRPWKQYSRTVYLESFMDSFIQPAGWLAWDGTFALDTLYYAEYNNTGPGSDTSNRVTWTGYHILTNSSDADNFTVSNFLLGDFWLPQTGVPYFGGLL